MSKTLNRSVREKGRALRCEKDKGYRCEQNKIIILAQLTLRSESGTQTYSNKNSGNRCKKDG